jgi:type IV secretory pathway VirB6-like protein
VRGLILANITPDNTPHGYNWTFAFPMLLFIVIAAILYVLFTRPHRRVPARRLAVGALRSARPDATLTRAAASGSAGTSAAAGGTTATTTAVPGTDEGVSAGQDAGDSE